MSTPLEEYPRPQMKRDSYLNLNGPWKCNIFNKNNNTVYTGNINVPYSPETVLSNVCVNVFPTDVLTYEKDVEIPANFNKGKILLNFGAVDQICYVYINDKLVYTHFGGYTPFSCDITNFIKDNKANIKLKVYDLTDKLELSRGKQSLKPGGINYTAQSGIWQTVWMESVPDTYIEFVKITPDVDNKSFLIKVKSNEYMPCEVYFQGKKYNITTNEVVRIPIDNPIFWDIDNPYLYDVKVKCGDDEVSTYFGYRKITIKNVNGKRLVFLNNRRLFMKGILEQGYYKDGLYTPDSYQTVEDDIKLIKELGFNTIRKHIKIEPAMYYYLCDKYGMLVIQDMVNGGGLYNKLVIGAPLFANIKLKDTHHNLFSRRNELAKKVFEYEIKESIKNLYNNPSIIMWTVFNEGWGQFDSKHYYELVQKLDQTRLIDMASGWYDQGLGDIKSHHVYFKPYKHKWDDRAVMLSEFGGYSLGSSKFTYKNLTKEEEYLKELKRLLKRDIKPYIDEGLNGYVYTQYNDIEDECNGLVDTDRKLKVKELSKIFKK